MPDETAIHTGQEISIRHMRQTRETRFPMEVNGGTQRDAFYDKG